MAGWFSRPQGYQPTQRDVWTMQREAQKEARRERRADAKEAARLREQMFKDELKADADARKAAQAAKDAADKEAAAEERAILTRVVLKRVDGTDGNPSGIPVWHWKAEPPKTMDVKVRRSGLGVILALPRAEQIASRHTVLWALQERKPWLIEQNPEWVEKSKTAISEAKERYLPLLRKLRDDRAMGYLFHAAGITMDTKRKETLAGTYGAYEREVTERSVPTLTDVVIDPDGLTLTYAARLGDSAKRWQSKADLLAAGFAAEGVNTAHLRITEGAGGSVRLEFNDSPSVFPRAVASDPVTVPHTVEEAIAAYPKLRWEFGVDARDNTIAAIIRDNPHIALIAQTGWGKSVTSASLIESLRPFGSWWLFDGKGSDHPAQLADQPGVSWISKSAPEHVVGMKWLWDEMNDRFVEADRRKAAGRASTAFDFPPIFVLIDETPSLRGGIDVHDKNGLESFDFWVTDLLQKGRQARIHLVIISQSLYVDSVPSDWQKNITRVLFLGPVSGRSLQSDTVPESARARVQEMTARIPDSAKGRGVYLDRSGGEVRPIQIQTYFDFAPGSVDMSMAPTPEVAAKWALQKESLADRPVLFDRIGIKVEDADWRKLTVDELADLPTVVIADEHGPVAGMECYDPLRKEFRGRVQIASNPNRARGRGSAAATTGHVAPQPTQHVPPTTPPNPAAAGMTDEEKQAEMRRIALENGWLKEEPDTEPEADQPETVEPEADQKTAAKKAAPRKAAPKKSNDDDDLSVGDF